MADESVSATVVINTSAEAIFAVLANPRMHAAIDGTGWIWRYYLAPVGSSDTTVTLFYDWSAVSDPIRERPLRRAGAMPQDVLVPAAFA